MKKRGQIWVETVIYTLIGIAIIGIVLAVAKPKIEQIKDEKAINQAIEAIGKINQKIEEVREAVGNRRTVELTINRGTLTIDTKNNKISWDLDSSFEYSEENKEISLGELKVKTTKADPWRVTIEKKYNLDIESDGATPVKKLNKAPTPYHIIIENNGVDSQGKQIIVIKEG